MVFLQRLAFFYHGVLYFCERLNNDVSMPLERNKYMLERIFIIQIQAAMTNWKVAEMCCKKVQFWSYNVLNAER